MANESCRHSEDQFIQIGDGFTMLYSISNDSKCQSFRFAYGFHTCFSINQDTWQIRHISNPTAIFLSFGFNLYLMQTRPQLRFSRNRIRACN